jgi:glycosyltransferase involved in cell wall biosynthesis
MNEHNTLTAEQPRVMFVCYLSTAGQSGYEIRVIEEARLVRQSGASVIILVFIHRKQLKKLWKVWKLYRRVKAFTGARVRIFPTEHFFDLDLPAGGAPEISNQIIRIAQRHRINIIHAEALYSAVHVLRVRDRFDAKVIFDVHGIAPEEAEMSASHPARVKRLTEWERDALFHADMRVYVSKAMRNFFERKYSIGNLPHCIVPCAVHSDKFLIQWETRDHLRRKLGLADRFVISYLGTLTVWQWPEAMFSLFAQLYKHKPDCFLYLLIPANDHEKARSFISQHNIPADAYRLEEISHDKVGSILGVADAGLLLRKSHPVNYVASPTKFGEYLAAGVPVIATDGIGDTSEIIFSEDIGLIVSPTDAGVNEGDLVSIESFIRKIFNNRREWSERCARAAKQILEWKQSAKVLIYTYDQLGE